MPNSSQHKKQLAHSENLLREDLFADLNMTRYPDWTITIYFYIVVHLIEAKLAELGLQPKSHKVRMDMMVDAGHIFTPILSAYRDLYNLSLKARYTCNAHKGIYAFIANNLYSEIIEGIA